MKIIKRLFSVFIVIGMLVTIIPMTPVNAEATDAKTDISIDFTGLSVAEVSCPGWATTNITTLSDGTKISVYLPGADTATANVVDSENGLLGDVFKLEHTATTSEGKLALGQFAFGAALELGELTGEAEGTDRYAEFMYTGKLGTSYTGMIMRVCSSTEKGRNDYHTEINLKADGKITVNGDNEVQSSATDNSSDFHTVRVQINLSTKTVTKVWVDDTETHSTALSFSASDGVDKIGLLRIAAGKNTTAGAVYIDDVNVITYTSDDGASPVSTHRAALGSKIEELSANESSAVQTAVATALAVYKNPLSADSEVQAQITALTSILEPKSQLAADFEGGDDASNGEYGTGLKSKKVTAGTPYTGTFASAALVTDSGAGDIMEAAFDISTSGIDASGEKVVVSFSDGETEEKLAQKIVFDGADNTIKAVYEGDAEKVVGKFVPNENTRIRLVNYINKVPIENKDRSKQFGIYVDGNNSANNQYFINSDIAEIDTMKVLVEGGGEALLDNVEVWTYNGTANAPSNKDLLLHEIRCAENTLKGNITDADKASINAALDAAKTEYLSNASTAATVNAACEALFAVYAAAYTKGESFAVKSVNLEDSNGAATNKLTAGGKIASVTVERKDDFGVAPMVITAIYDGDVLVAADVDTETKANGDNTVTVDLACPEDAAAPEYKVFVFGSSDISPLADNVAKKAGRTIFIAGDSLVESYNHETRTEGEESYTDYPQDGWGKYIAENFDNTKITVNNLATRGYTTKNFWRAPGHMETVYKNAKQGDYLLVSFMANDMKSMTVDEYEQYLRAFYTFAKDNGIKLVFVASTPRIKDFAEGTWSYSYGDWRTAMLSFATATGTPLVDAYDLVVDYQTDNDKIYESLKREMYLFGLKETFGLTEEELESFYNQNAAAEAGTDETHLNANGAKMVGGWISKGLMDIIPELKLYSK